MSDWKNSEKNKFEVTGTFPLKRDVYIRWLEDECDYTHTSLSEANMLIVGDNPGSKVMKAIEKKIEIVYIDDVLEHFGAPFKYEDMTKEELIELVKELKGE